MTAIPAAVDLLQKKEELLFAGGERTPRRKRKQHSDSSSNSDTDTDPDPDPVELDDMDHASKKAKSPRALSSIPVPTPTDPFVQRHSTDDTQEHQKQPEKDIYIGAEWLTDTEKFPDFQDEADGLPSSSAQTGIAATTAAMDRKKEEERNGKRRLENNNNNRENKRLPASASTADPAPASGVRGGGGGGGEKKGGGGGGEGGEDGEITIPPLEPVVVNHPLLKELASYRKQYENCTEAEKWCPRCKVPVAEGWKNVDAFFRTHFGHSKMDDLCRETKKIFAHEFKDEDIGDSSRFVWHDASLVDHYLETDPSPANLVKRMEMGLREQLIILETSGVVSLYADGTTGIQLAGAKQYLSVMKQLRELMPS